MIGKGKHKRRKERLNAKVERPQKTDEQVYVTRGGKCYHTVWCTAINGVWLSGSNAILVIPWNTVGERHWCALCVEEGEVNAIQKAIAT